jgi:hypothetical protein
MSDAGIAKAASRTANAISDFGMCISIFRDVKECPQIFNPHCSPIGNVNGGMILRISGSEDW